jgi:hypothetical protein
MNASTKIIALAGVLGTLALAGCGPGYDRGYGSYGGYSGSDGNYDRSYSYDRSYDRSYRPSYEAPRERYYGRSRNYYDDDYGQRQYYRYPRD